MFGVICCAHVCCERVSSSTAATADKGWAGTWEASAGEIISVTGTDGFLDILSKDSISIYSCTGIIEGNSVWCYGSGKNH